MSWTLLKPKTSFTKGEVRKWRGSLTEHDLAAVRRLVTDSRDYVVEASGYTVDVLS